MRKVSSLSDVQLVLNDLNNKLETLSTKAQNLNGRQIKNAGNATDPQDYVTLAQLKAVNLTTISGSLQKHQITSVDASVISGNLNFNTGIFGNLSTQQLTISKSLTLSPGVGIVLTNANLNLVNSSIECGGFITIAPPNALVLSPTFDVGNQCLRVLYPPYGAGSGVPIPNPNPYGILNVAGMQFPIGYGQIRCDAVIASGGLNNGISSTFAAPGIALQGNTSTTLTFGNTALPQAGFRWNNPNLNWSNDLATWINFPTNKLYAEFTGTTQTITAGAGFTNVTSCSVTVNATGTWRIDCNAFVQQTAAAAATASIRFTRNGSGDTRTAGGGGGSAQYSLHYNVSLSLTSGDVIQLQCSAVTNNASLLGTGNTGCTNITAIFLGA